MPLLLLRAPIALSTYTRTTQTAYVWYIHTIACFSFFMFFFDFLLNQFLLFTIASSHITLIFVLRMLHAKHKYHWCTNANVKKKQTKKSVFCSYKYSFFLFYNYYYYLWVMHTVPDYWHDDLVLLVISFFCDCFLGLLVYNIFNIVHIVSSAAIIIFFSFIARLHGVNKAHHVTTLSMGFIHIWYCCFRYYIFLHFFFHFSLIQNIAFGWNIQRFVVTLCVNAVWYLIDLFIHIGHYWRFIALRIEQKTNWHS